MFEDQCSTIGLGQALQTDSHVKCLHSVIIGLCEWVCSLLRDKRHVGSMGHLVRLVAVIKGRREEGRSQQGIITFAPTHLASWT